MNAMLRFLSRGSLLALAIAGATGALACAASDSGSGFSSGGGDGGHTPDAASPDTSVFPEDGPGGDAPAIGPDANSGDGGAPDAAPPTTTVVFVHASPSLPSMRLCFAQLGTEAPFPANNEMPASNYAGIPVGGAVWRTEIGGTAVVGDVYALRAKPIAGNPASCGELVCSAGGGANCLMLNGDYWHVGQLVAGDVALGGTTVVAVSGCRGAEDPFAGTDLCGPDWTAATGNLHLNVLHVAASAPSDAGLLTVQAAQLSPGLQALQGDAGSATVSFGTQADAQALTKLASEGDLEPVLPTSIVLPSALSAFGELGFAVGSTSSDPDASSAGRLWMSLAQAQELVNPAQDPNVYYGAGGTYVVAVLGDPNAPHAFASGLDGGGYDGKGLHVLLLPPTPLP